MSRPPFFLPLLCIAQPCSLNRIRTIGADTLLQFSFRSCCPDGLSLLISRTLPLPPLEHQRALAAARVLCDAEVLHT